MIFAQIKSGVVINTIVADSLEIANSILPEDCISVDITEKSVGPGWVYDEETQSFSNPFDPDAVE